MRVDWIDARYLDDAAKLLLLLHPSYSIEGLTSQLEMQQLSRQYKLIGVFKEDELVGVAGFVEGLTFAWGRNLLIEDFVIAPPWRYTGMAEQLIAWLRHYGLQLGCKEIHVNSGVQDFFVHKFYLQEGFRISSHHFSLQLQADAAAHVARSNS
ncbi:GNAT family N-acetyltransferase [Celerinatantimonas yamalensis]|uniref:GNAT family N-acetyltransferase n=1 Tax=Celerinatantimonas yamalensis TaxID=559956 RepID=A0ABW9G2T5_9GAMM